MNKGRPGSPRVWSLLCAALTLVILWLALLPAGSAPSGLGWDKLNHAGAVGIATGLAYLSLQSCSWAASGALLYGTFLGALIELLQATMTTGRSAEWGDLLADMVGAGLVWIVIRTYQLKTASEH